MNIKKIIAREGLIILGCVACAIFFYTVSSFLPYSRPTYVYKCSTGGRIYQIEKEDYIYGFDLEEKRAMLKDIIRKYPADITEPTKTIVEEFKGIPADFEAELFKTKYTVIGHIKNLFETLAIWALFLAYPLYLIIRFTIWAIRTLRKN